MNSSFVLGVLLGILGALLMNVGKGVQKSRVHVLLHGRGMVAPQHRRDLWIWLAGMAMTVGSAVPFAAGIWLSGSPSTIAAMTGVGLVGLTIFASRSLGERIGTLDGIGIALVVAGTSVLSYIGAERPLTERALATAPLIATLVLSVVAAAIPCLVAVRIRRIHGLACGVAAGTLIGVAMFLADAGVVAASGSLGGALRSPFPWISMGSLALALVLTQVGFVRGKALEVVPALNSSIILAPLAFEMLVYGRIPAFVSALPVTLIVVGVVLLSTRGAARMKACQTPSLVT